MAEEETKLEIEVERAPPGAKAFIPEEDKVRVEFKLEPEPPTVEEMAPYVQPVWKYRAPPLVAAVKRALLVDIETTGLLPWESRFMVIGVRDLTDPNAQGIVLYHPDEEQLLREFITFFKDGGYEEIVAYNLPFDMRFIFAKGMRYQLPIRALIEAEWTDLAWRMQQVKFVRSATRQKPGKLEDWAQFLFGEGKLMSYKELLEAWGEGNIDKIKEYSLKDLDLTAKLWMVSEFVLTGDPWAPQGEEIEGIEAEKPREVESPTAVLEEEVVEGWPSFIEGYREVVSKHSQAQQWIPRFATKFKDFVTGKVETV